MSVELEGIPDLNSRGFLPFRDSEPTSIYPCTRDQLGKVFGINRHRREILGAFDIWVRELRRICKVESVWISGSFVSSKVKPRDIDVAGLIPQETPEDVKQALGERPDLITLQHVTAQHPPRDIDRLQPVTGLVDGFLLPDQPIFTETFRRGWTSIWENGIDTGERKGMVEVTFG